ncbi:MAG TPA: VOC family protein [Polyangiaceae bacterium]|jgi:predicted 3-demethylubiquinone-9 3-methyltransferase (glyoxalase superfamily)
MTTSITTFLTYDTQAEDAAKLYTSLFDGKITTISRYPAGGPKPEGAVLSVTFELFGQTYIALNGGPTFTFGQGFSLMVQVGTQAEIDRLWKALTDNGGKEVQCGWLTDRFGVSWQIVPRGLGEMLADRDRAKSSRAMAAMMGMRKLDIAKLRAAFDGA